VKTYSLAFAEIKIDRKILKHRPLITEDQFRVPVGDVNNEEGRKSMMGRICETGGFQPEGEE